MVILDYLDYLVWNIFKMILHTHSLSQDEFQLREMLCCIQKMDSFIYMCLPKKMIFFGLIKASNFGIQLIENKFDI